MKKAKFMLSLMLTTALSQYAVASNQTDAIRPTQDYPESIEVTHASSEKTENITPTLSYQLISDKYNIAVNVFAFMSKPMYVSYRDDLHCSYKDESPEYVDDVYTSGLKEIDLVENSQYQLTIHPIKIVDGSVETLLVFVIPDKSKNEIYQIDKNCSLELGEKTFKKYTIIQKFKPNEMTPVKVGDNYVEVKLIELDTPKEIL